MKITRIVLILGLVVLLSVGMVLAQPPGDLAAKKKQANADLDAMAQEVSKLVTHPGFRGFLRSEIAKSKNRENILELDKFLDRASKQKGMPPGLAKLKDYAGKAKGRLKASGIWKLAKYDLYIPVGANRAKWKGGKDFLVAFSPVDDEKDTKQIIAYRVNDGKRVILDPNKPPQTPILVLAPCEHENHAKVSAPKGPKTPPENPKPNFKGENVPPPQGMKEPGIGNSSVGVQYLKIYNDHEPWYKGDPEIYIDLCLRKVNECQRRYSNLSFVNNEGRWYYIWSYANMSFDSTYWQKMKFYIWERDGGSWKTDLIQIYPGIVCRLVGQNYDNFVASAEIYRSSFNYNYSYYHRVHDAYIIWYKVH